MQRKQKHEGTDGFEYCYVQFPSPFSLGIAYWGTGTRSGSAALLRRTMAMDTGKESKITTHYDKVVTGIMQELQEL